MSRTQSADVDKSESPTSVFIESVDELEAHLDDLPKPSEDPDARYVHPGKKYAVAGGNATFTIVGLYPDATANGVVVFEMEDDVRAYSEHELSKCGVHPTLLEQYEPEADHKGVMSVNAILRQLGDLEIREVDACSYGDVYWNCIDGI